MNPSKSRPSASCSEHRRNYAATETTTPVRSASAHDTECDGRHVLSMSPADGNCASGDVKQRRQSQPRFVPLECESRSLIPTKDAAWHLGRKEQTLRVWACYETGPIRPVRINGRLGWPVADIRKLVSGGLN